MKKGTKTKCYKCGRIFYEQEKERTKPFITFVDDIIYKFDTLLYNTIFVIDDKKKCSNCGRLFYKKKIRSIKGFNNVS